MRHRARDGGFESEITIARRLERCAVCGQELPDLEPGVFDFCSFCGSGILLGPVAQPVKILAGQTGRARP